MLLAATALCLCGPAGDAPPRPPLWHSVAFVNDPLSHGLVGDALLSLNEAILLHNGQLTFAALSAAEQARLSLIPGTGTTTDVTWIDIDASNTPVITIQQDLAPVLDTTFGLLIKGFGGRPVIDFTGPGITQGLVSPSNSLVLQDLVLLGGPFGVDVVQTDVSGQAGLVLTNVRIEGQTGFGLRVVATSQNGVGRVILENCELVGRPNAIVHDESGSGRTTIVEVHGLFVRGATVGVDATLGSGGSTRYTFDHVDVEASTLGLRLSRPPGANRQAFIEGDYVRIRAADGALLACHPTAWTWAVLRLWDVQAAAGRVALRLGQAGDAWFGEVQDLASAGDVELGAGGAAGQGITLANWRCTNGNVALATSPAQNMTCSEARFDNCAVVANGTSPIAMNGCCFVGGTIAGAPAAPFVLNGCFASSTGANVQVTSPLPQAQLGSMSITPENVLAGGTVTFQADLPPGLVGVFVLGFTPDAPLLAPPFRIYVDLASYVLWPGAYALQQSATWQVPAGVQFVGIDLTAQMLVLPAGTQAPWLQMPPGRRFVLQ